MTPRDFSFEALETWVREAVDEVFTAAEHGRLWVGGVGTCMPLSSAPDDPASHARRSATAGIFRHLRERICEEAKPRGKD